MTKLRAKLQCCISNRLGGVEDTNIFSGRNYRITEKSPEDGSIRKPINFWQHLLSKFNYPLPQNTTYDVIRTMHITFMITWMCLLWHSHVSLFTYHSGLNNSSICLRNGLGGSFGVIKRASYFVRYLLYISFKQKIFYQDITYSYC